MRFWIFILSALANLFTMSVLGPAPLWLTCAALCLWGAWRSR